jgi:hypothetical protein
MTPCSPLKVNRRFGGTCRLCLQGRRISQARNQRKAGSKQSTGREWYESVAAIMLLTLRCWGLIQDWRGLPSGMLRCSDRWKSTAFHRNMLPLYSWLKSNRLPFCFTYSSILMMEATCSSETTIEFYRTIRRYIPEARTLRNHRCENLRSYIMQDCLSLRMLVQNVAEAIHIWDLFWSPARP